MCVVVLPIGLSCLRVFQLCHSMRDTRWVFCCSRGRGAGMLKMADFSPSPLAGRVGVGAMFKSHCKDTYHPPSAPRAAPANLHRRNPSPANNPLTPPPDAPDPDALSSHHPHHNNRTPIVPRYLQTLVRRRIQNNSQAELGSTYTIFLRRTRRRTTRLFLHFLNLTIATSHYHERKDRLFLRKAVLD